MRNVTIHDIPLKLKMKAIRKLIEGADSWHAGKRIPVEEFKGCRASRVAALRVLREAECEGEGGDG